jgi:hypothetical protein
MEPEGEAGVTLGLVGISEGGLEVRWVGEKRDGQPADDRAFWVLRRAGERRYRISGAADPFLEHALSAVSGWRRALPAESADMEIVIGRSPDPEGPPFLWIDPPELRRRVLNGARVLEWDRIHPALRHVDLHPVRLGNVPEIRRPAGARVLAASTAGPMILEGVRDDRRYLAWAFDPMETDLPLSVAFPVLVHNAMEHLAPASASLPGGISTGESPVLPWPEPGPAELVAPSGRRRPVKTAGGMLHLPAIDETGIWRLESGGRDLAFAASLLSEDESDLRGTGFATPETASTISAPSGTRMGIQDLWKPLVLAGLLLLLLEGWAFHRRWLA